MPFSCRLARSLSFRFAAVLFLVLAVGQGVGAVAYLLATRAAGLTALHERMARTLLQVAGVSTQPLWDLDYEFLEPYLDEVMKDPDIQAVCVRDGTGAVVSSRSRDAGPAPFGLVRSIIANGEGIGRVELGYRQDSVDASVARSLVQIPVYQGIMLAVLAVASSVLVRVYVRRPVVGIAGALRRISAGELTVPLPEGRDDEIAEIARGVNFLRERLHHTVTQAREIAASVTQVSGQLDALFADVARAAVVQQGATEEVAGALSASTALQGEVLERTGELLALSEANLGALTAVHDASEEIAVAAAELTGSVDDSHATLARLTASSRQVARMAAEVARAVEGASSSVQQVFAAVKEVESRVGESADLSARVTCAVSDQGLASAARARDQVGRIEAFMEVLGAAVERLGARSGDVGGVLRVVTGVTDRIRLLSLNAQILAVQAGEHGKPFGVVAGEMEALSKKSAESSREIGATLEEIGREIREVVRRAAEASGSLQAVKHAVAATEGVQQEILGSSRQAAQTAARIQGAAREQTAGLELVVGAITQITSRVFEVTEATREEEQGNQAVLANVDRIRHAMAGVRERTGAQERLVATLLGNLEASDGKTQAIAATSVQQSALKQTITREVGGVAEAGRHAIERLEGIPQALAALARQTEALRQTLAVFRTASPEAAPPSPCPTAGQASPEGAPTTG